MAVVRKSGVVLIQCHLIKGSEILCGDESSKSIKFLLGSFALINLYLAFCMEVIMSTIDCKLVLTVFRTMHVKYVEIKVKR
jgi:hypothetical protein